ncbi:CCA-adding enzyme [Paenibacillus plantiphilus]|uniref:CCA-adding enzyme n=1 Tax=Paenibacillus plantiphilus TaxID=2905650 RepID=A0ABN8GVY5_9BACL|nr:CCA tRNA nucleotidyltransferase [Paenibacillus plantiphilus]CAH1218326.1 CCA-adding enzyme [Paenibacillus plantiphilus]
MKWNEALYKALPVLDSLESSGYEAVFVGGCVRDTIMGRQLKDVDIASSATPHQVMEIFPHTIATGLKHGTVTVMQDGEAYEITTYRTESSYEQFRRPAQVEFVTSLEADLERRDFTINAIAMRRDGTLVDPYGGLLDMERRILRCVGDSDARFQEDALRMVRAVRFAAEFRMDIAADTWHALRRHGKLLSHVAMERVGAESDKMLGGSNPLGALLWMAASGLLAHTKQKLSDKLTAAAEVKLSDNDAGERCVSVMAPSHCKLGAISSLEHLDDRWSALCMACSLTADETAELIASMCYSNGRRSQISAVVRVYRWIQTEAAASVIEDGQLRLQWTRVMLDEGRQASQACLHIMDRLPALFLPASGGTETRHADGGGKFAPLQRWLDELPISSLRELAVDGAEMLQALGRPGGPWLGRLLNELVFAVASHQVSNDRDRLLAYAAASMEVSGSVNKADKESS